jgi:hypothetical protein
MSSLCSSGREPNVLPAAISVGRLQLPASQYPRAALVFHFYNIFTLNLEPTGNATTDLPPALANISMWVGIVSITSHLNPDAVLAVGSTTSPAYYASILPISNSNDPDTSSTILPVPSGASNGQRLSPSSSHVKCICHTSDAQAPRSLQSAYSSPHCRASSDDDAGRVWER